MAFHDIAAQEENVYNIAVGRWWYEMKAAKMFDGKVMERIAGPRNWGIGIIEK